MDSDGGSINDVNSIDPDVEWSKLDLTVEISLNEEMGGELKYASEVLTRVELYLAYTSEKLLNLNVFMMHVATKESEFETLDSANGDASVGSMEMALEFDLLSGILDSEVTELDQFMEILHRDILEAGEMISSCGQLGSAVTAMKEKVRDSEELLKQSRDQVSEIREQSAKFQQTLAYFKGEEIENAYEGPNFLNTNPKINMQTSEQQRHVLRTLEKSLAREMDLEKKLSESRQIEEELKHQLLSLEQQAFFMEEETMDICRRKFEAENASEVFMGISKELLGLLQILQFNFNGSVQREYDIRSKLEKSIDQVEAKDSSLKSLDVSTSKHNDLLICQADSLKASLLEAENKLVLANSKACTLQEKMSALENQLKESELNAKENDALLSDVAEIKNALEDFKEKLSKAESRAEISEAKCKSFEEINTQLHEELGRLKGTSEKVDSLERQLRESKIKLQHAVASAKASQEKQILLNSTITDMECLIGDLKSKVSKAESRADSTEDKCIMLSEANAELNEKLNFLRGRLECVEASLNHAEETRIVTAKDIGFRTKVITDLVMQLAIERERLHNQISSLAMENKTLVRQLHHARKKPADFNFHNNGNGENTFHPVEEVIETAVGSQEDNTLKTIPVDDTKVVALDDKSESELENVQRVDAGLLSFRHILIAMLIVLVSAAFYMFHPVNIRL